MFYIDQSGIISGKVGSGRDISRPTNRRSGRSADVGIGLPEQRSFEERPERGSCDAAPKVSCASQVGISEKRWVEARQWAGGRTSKTKYQMPRSQRLDGTVAGSTKRLASRFYQVKTGHCLSGQYIYWTKNWGWEVLVAPVPDSDPGVPPQGVPRVEGPAEDPVGGGAEGDWEAEEPVEDSGPPRR